MITNFNGEGINTLPANVSLPIATSGKSIALNGERLDNAAFVVAGSNTLWPQLADQNNVGFLYDVPPTKKILV